jgi:predicted nucleic-acid-binding protein
MKEPERAVLDTNLLVRYLTDDDKGKADDVERLLKRAGAGEIKLCVPSIVIAELVWVLESFYEMDRESVAGLVESVLNTPGVETQDKSMISTAVRNYRVKSLDFIDAWIAEFARRSGIETVYTFDKKHFKDQEGIKAVSPA